MALEVQVRNAMTMMIQASVEPYGISIAFAAGHKGTMPYRQMEGIPAERIRELALPTPYVLEVRLASGETEEFPWDYVRACCDSGYLTRMQELDREGRRIVGERIQGLRKAAGMTQEQLASAAGLDTATVDRIENGEQSPRFETLERIEERLGWPIEDLLGA